MTASKTQREPFADFAKLGRGIPYFTYHPNRKTAHVHWSDGTMWHYIEFSSALDKEGMAAAFQNAFTRHKAEAGNRCTLSYGNVGGCLFYGPIPLAMEVRAIVLDHYTRALAIVAAKLAAQGTAEMTATTPAQLKHTARLPFGFSATFTWSSTSGTAVEWDPHVPQITSPRARSKFYKAYRDARRAFYQDIATVIGGAALIVDMDGTSEVVMPAQKH